MRDALTGEEQEQIATALEVAATETEHYADELLKESKVGPYSARESHLSDSMTMRNKAREYRTLAGRLRIGYWERTE